MNSPSPIGAAAPSPGFGQSSVVQVADEGLGRISSTRGFLQAIQPLKGKLQVLPTKAEAEAGLKLVDAHIVCVQAQDANNVLKLIDSTLPAHAVSHLQHLRRVARSEFLPPCVKYQLEANNSSSEHSPLRSSEITYENKPPFPSRPSSSSRDPSPSNSRSSSRSSNKCRRKRRGSSAKRKSKLLYLIAAPTSVLSSEQLTSTLQPYAHSLYVFAVPSTPPPSQEHALEWSNCYWPTVYKAHNPFGPQPVFVTRAQDTMASTAGLWMKIARLVAKETRERHYGQAFGAVVVDQYSGFDGPLPIVAAGDARWMNSFPPVSQQNNPNGEAIISSSKSSSCTHDNPAAHAALRAIGMVARQRVGLSRNGNIAPMAVEEHLTSGPASLQAPGIFFDYPITPLESEIYNRSPLPRGGYLCAGLELWLSHEPCVMCSMAILHSRFERVVFGQRMPDTGGLVGDNSGLGYGLFWRSELNWKMIGWEWIEDGIEQSELAADRGRKREQDNGSNTKVHV